MFKIIEKIPFMPLLLIAIIMLLLPVTPMPHVLEKLIMLKNGELTQGIDIFDLFYHLAPSILLIVKVVVGRMHKDS